LYFIGLIGSNLFLAPDRIAAVIPAAIIDFIILAAGLRIAQNFFQKSLLMRGWLAIASYLGVLTTLSVLVVLVNQYLLLGGPTLLTLAISIPQNLVILMLFTLAISIFSLLQLPPISQQAGSDLWQTDISMGGSISRAVDSFVKRRLAHHLHSTVQNRVLALKMGYPTGAQFNPGEIEERVLSIITDAKAEFIEQQTTTLEDRMAQLQDEWAPVLTMHFVNSTGNLTLVQQTLFFLVLQECVTNSVRHGLATEVSASLERWPPADPNNFRLRVSDNGVGPVGKNRKEGVGMRFLDELSGGSYYLGFGDNGGATLEALIRC
jgi:signal transduction histidine kinase